jgi:hypothetical protein
MCERAKLLPFAAKSVAPALGLALISLGFSGGVTDVTGCDLAAVTFSTPLSD